MGKIRRPTRPIAETLFRDNWPRRRKWMSWVLIWAMTNSQIIICASVLRSLSPFPKENPENALLIQALLALLAMIASTMGYYVFGAVWDDNDKRKHLADREDFNPYGPLETQTAVVTTVPASTNPDPSSPTPGYVP